MDSVIVMDSPYDSLYVYSLYCLLELGELCRSGQYMINDSLLRDVIWITCLDIDMVVILRAMTVLVTIFFNTNKCMILIQ
jgi:hypothetical protein